MTPGQPCPRPSPWGPLSGEAFRAERKELRLTQRRLAQAAGITPETLCRFERGKEKPSMTTRLVLLLLLRVPGALEMAEGRP